MEKNQTVSLIIPIYNKEKYLKRCLDSVVNQTYRELEILLVDDGSTDASRSICEEYAKRDTRIKVIPKENGGVSSARNLGMEHSTGTYLAFADPDDFIHLEFVERLKNLLEQTGAEISFCPFLTVSPALTFAVPVLVTMLSTVPSSCATRLFGVLFVFFFCRSTSSSRT